MKTKILMVDDNKDIIDIMLPHFSKENLIVDTAKDGVEAYQKIEANTYDLLLLDVMMPKMDGFTLCKKIRETSNVPIIMITARTEDEDVIMGLDIGADDYIVKPFSPKQVIAKIKALMRRLDIKNNDKQLEIGHLSIDMATYKASINNKEMPLTKKEIEILYLFAKHPNIVYERETLLDMLWGEDYFGEPRTVDTHIKRLRAKINEYNPDFEIKTVWGVGYKYEKNIK
jgi:two-component system, OmpR family, response regulator ResD